ncbi:MAG: PilZ domain-containing protein [Gammaproteobacteria bacterium]|nr:PilZ domain-containing protein [Gammaproteobacteria bacterium]MCB1798723.1 PilZ domain-containing protein [Gammaproteobacteria bacterium]MCP5414426.1 PilZ domain-containing protein [Chromatiaceae bacterium]
MTENERHKESAAERRHYFRIDDTIRLSLRRVPKDELDARLDRLEHDLAGNFTVMSSLAAITAQTAVSLRRIENRDPDLAAYLRAIDHKIEVIGRAFIAQEPELAAEKALPVNLSAGGMSVGVEECFEPGADLELRMLLFPSFTGLMIYATVVECRPATPQELADGYRHLARIEFTHIREQDRELLIRHLLRRQSNQLREDREGDDKA